MNTLLDGGDKTPELDETKNYLEELVGEGKKFKTPEDLAKGKYLADRYVEDLIRQREDLKADYLKMRDENVTRAKLEDLLTRLENSAAPKAEETEKPIPPPFDSKQLDSLITSRIQTYESEKRGEDNFNIVKKRLADTLGPNYQSVLKNRIDELRLDVADVDAMARKSPNAVFRMLELDAKSTEGYQAPPRNQRADVFTPTSEKRTWSYYQKLKAKQPRLYLDPKTQVQMHKDHAALGDEFEDGDWNDMRI